MDHPDTRSEPSPRQRKGFRWWRMGGWVLLAIVGVFPELVRPPLVAARDASPIPAPSSVGAPDSEVLESGDTLDIDLVNGDRLHAAPCVLDSQAWRMRVADNVVWRVPVAAIRSFGYPTNERLMFPSAVSLDAERTGARRLESGTPRRIELPNPLTQGRVTFLWRADPGETPIGEFRMVFAKPVGKPPLGDAVAGESAALTWMLPPAGKAVALSSTGAVTFARTPWAVEAGWHRFTWESSGRTTRVSVDDRVVAERSGAPLNIAVCEWVNANPVAAGDEPVRPVDARVRNVRIVRYTAPVGEVVAPQTMVVPGDAVLLHDGSTLFGTVPRVSTSSVRLIPSTLRGGASEGIEIPWGEIRRVERSSMSAVQSIVKNPGTPWGLVTRLEWRGRDARGAETRQRWRVVLAPGKERWEEKAERGNDGSKHEADLLAFHHPVVGGVALPTSAVVHAKREFEGALTWLGEPARPFDPLRAESQSWEVRFDLPEGSRPLAAPPAAVLVCELRGLPRTARDMARLTFPEASLPDGLPSGSRSIAVEVGAEALRATGRSDLRLTVNGQSVGRLSDRLPAGANVERLTTIRMPLPRAVLRDKGNTLVIRLVPEGAGPATAPLTTTAPSEARGPIQVKSALIEWTN